MVQLRGVPAGTGHSTTSSGQRTSNCRGNGSTRTLIEAEESQEITKEAVGIHVLLTRSLFGDGTLRKLLRRVSLAKPTSGLTAAINIYRANAKLMLPQNWPKVRVPVMGVWGEGDIAFVVEQMIASEKYVSVTRGAMNGSETALAIG